MTRDLYADLAWLLPAPEDFRARRRALMADDATQVGAGVQALARHALNATQLTQLAETIAAAQARGADLAPLAPFTLGLVGNGTLDLIAPALVASAARHGVALRVVTAPYGQVIQEALNPHSAVNAAKPDAVLLALDHRGAPLSADLASAEASVKEAIGYINALKENFKANAGAPCIVQTIAAPAEALFGSFDRRLAAAQRAAIDAFNRALASGETGSDDILLDVAGLAETVGLARWHSPSEWNLAKLPFSSTYLALYADHVGRLIGAMRGKARKCLILDLDNTCWGGVIGDDGLDGIRIAEGDAEGEAFRDVQRTALALRARGVVLAVSSKNNDEVARAAFREHPEMILRESHIAVFQANWNDKATNIKAIAEELNLGLDAMAFLDDNPVERGLVRAFLPQVAVPELPEDPALYARTLTAAGYFEAIAFSEEDRKRAGFYEDNAKRAALASAVGSLDDYLASLDMEISFAPFDQKGRERIAQLINKSNQFNLTTRRYTEAEVAAFEADPACFTLQIRLADKFGDNGMISVILCKAQGDAWEIDTWLMSCRVLGRKVEQMALRELMLHARAQGVARLIGRYIPTARNGMVKDHYETLGFVKQADGARAGETTWAIATDAETPAAAPMRVVRVGALNDALPQAAE
ncbi:MAG: HAD-IIIC family phosphatase [Alphaproteobacteria bacterium]|nr:HAD-IIIC family phosphatase [Alphaproteobacteria bacterium]